MVLKYSCRRTFDMVFTRISCVVCGVLGFWGYDRPDSVYELIKVAHLKSKGENHEVTMEKGK